MTVTVENGIANGGFSADGLAMDKEHADRDKKEVKAKSKDSWAKLFLDDYEVCQGIS